MLLFNTESARCFVKRNLSALVKHHSRALTPDTFCDPLLQTLNMRFHPDSLPFNDPKECRRVAIVTGANSGLGYYTTMHLYLHGWSVYMACRDLSKADEAARSLVAEAQSRSENISDFKLGAIYLLKLDLGDLASVQETVKEFLSKEQRLE